MEVVTLKNWHYLNYKGHLYLCVQRKTNEFLDVYGRVWKFQEVSQSEANAVGENSSFIFTVCVKSVRLYHFKLAFVVLHVAVKGFFETHF